MQSEQNSDTIKSKISMSKDDDNNYSTTNIL